MTNKKNVPLKKLGGYEFRYRRGEIYFSKKYTDLHDKYISVGAEIVIKNNLNIEKIVKDFGYDPDSHNEFVTAKMSFYVYCSVGKRLMCSQNEMRRLSYLLLGKSFTDRERATGEKFELEKTNGCFS